MSEQTNNIVNITSRLEEKERDLSDAELLSGYINGDTNAFDTFYERHKKKLFNYALRFTDYKSADAEDVVMDVFLNFTKKLLGSEEDGESFVFEKFGDNGSAQAYLFTMIRNQAIGTHRLAYKSKEVSLEMKGDDDQFHSMESTDTHSLEEARAMELQHAVTDSIWQPVNQLERSLAEAHYPIDKKRLANELEKAVKLAEVLSQIYELLMAGISTAKIAEFIGIDRKTLQTRRKLLAELLQPLLPELSQ